MFMAIGSLLLFFSGVTLILFSYSDRYEFRWKTIDGVCGWIDEHLNYCNWYTDILTMEENEKIRICYGSVMRSHTILAGGITIPYPVGYWHAEVYCDKTPLIKENDTPFDCGVLFATNKERWKGLNAVLEYVKKLVAALKKEMQHYFIKISRLV